MPREAVLHGGGKGWGRGLAADSRGVAYRLCEQEKRGSTEQDVE